MAGTWADVLDRMMLLNNELETAAGEDDEANALIAATEAQHYFETLAATFPRVLQTVVDSTTTTNATESTLIPTSMLRFDGMQLLQSGRPVRFIDSLQRVGSHAPGVPFPITLISIGGGAPSAFYMDSERFRWMPLPDSTYTVRLYGLFEKAVPANRGVNFDYPLRCQLAFAQFAVYLLKHGVDDDTSDIDAFALKVYRPLLKQLKNVDRSGSKDRMYDYLHSS